MAAAALKTFEIKVGSGGAGIKYSTHKETFANSVDLAAFHHIKVGQVHVIARLYVPGAYQFALRAGSIDIRLEDWQRAWAKDQARRNGVKWKKPPA